MEVQENSQIQLKDNSELNKYISELKEDVTLNVRNLREKSFLISTIRTKWLGYFYRERENLERIKAAKTKVIKKAQASVTQKDSVLRLKSEEGILANNETLQKLNKLQEITKENIDFIEHAMNVLTDFIWQVKNSIEILKLEKL